MGWGERAVGLDFRPPDKSVSLVFGVRAAAGLRRRALGAFPALGRSAPDEPDVVLLHPALACRGDIVEMAEAAER